MIANLRKNIMGTVSFDAQFPGMRKPQDFIVYPMKEAARNAKIQSDTRMGMVNLENGDVLLSKPRSSGAGFIELARSKVVCKVSAEELLNLKAAIMGTASGKAGTNGCVYVDNSGALEVFGSLA